MRSGFMVRSRKAIAIMLVFTLVFGFLSAAGAKPAQAKSSRMAVVTDVGGDAQVKSAGGSRYYDIYEDMGLNQGDYIRTGSDSYITLKLSDTGSEMTLGEDGALYISDLGKKGSGSKNKFKLWAGSMWSKVKKLAGSDDAYDVETPTSVMGVQGTHFFVSVNPKSGQTFMTVAAGLVSVTTTADATSGNNAAGSAAEKKVLLAPAQQITLDSRTEVDDLETKVSTLDISELVNIAPPQVIKAFIQDKADIDTENQELLNQLNQSLQDGKTTSISRGGAVSSLTIKSLDDLNKVSANLDNLIGNVAKSAIDSGAVSKTDMDKLIQQVNSNTTDPAKKIDLSTVKPLDKTAGVDPAQQKTKTAALKKLEEEKAKQADLVAQQIQAFAQQNAALIAQLNQLKALLDGQNKQILADEKTKAEQKYTAILSETDKQRFEQDKAKNTSPSPTPQTVILPASISLNKTSVTLKAGQEETLTATVQPLNADNRNVIWDSSDPTVAAVSSLGKVTAIKPGTAKIHAVSAVNSGISAEATVTVEPTVSPSPGVRPTGVSIIPPTPISPLLIGQTSSFSATVSPSNASQQIVWSSDNNAVATVSSTGVVTAKGPGTATIIAAAPNSTFSASTTVTVLAPEFKLSTKPAPAVETSPSPNEFLVSVEANNLYKAYGIEVHLEFSPNAGGLEGYPYLYSSSEIMNMDSYVEHVGGSANSITYAAIAYNGAVYSGVSTGSSKLLFTIPYYNYLNFNASGTIKITSVKIVDGNGDVIYEKNGTVDEKTVNSILTSPPPPLL